MSCSSITKSGRQCSNPANFSVGSEARCGQHSRKDASRVAIQRPAFDLQAQMVKARSMRVGQVRLQRMRMLRSVQQLPGYVCVFPNFKHGGRKDGIGMPQLSPMSLGPVEHGQPGLPPALNLENFWQQSKCFPGEIDFKQARIDGYLDPVPHRHKQKGGKPLYWSWIRHDGTELQLSYIDARRYYCRFYEQLVKRTEQWEQLTSMLDEEMGIQLCGYDAWPMDVESIEREYRDESRPFGHERVLFAMLVLFGRDYPWSS